MYGWTFGGYDNRNLKSDEKIPFIKRKLSYNLLKMLCFYQNKVNLIKYRMIYYTFTLF